MQNKEIEEAKQHRHRTIMVVLEEQNSSVDRGINRACDGAG